MDHRHELLEGLTDIQRHAVQVEAAPLCILAGAGSGKTRVLTRRIAWRLAGGSAQPAHVLALTFTRKASGELRQRLAALGVREQVAAGTFHAVAYAQLRRRWADLGQTAPTLLQRKVGLLGRLLDPPRRG
ncbi:MAG: UvrD-helicase domain-containing protein, partial [Actinomycetes bacterium]